MKSLYRCLFLILISFHFITTISANETWVSIDSLVGNVEVQRAGQKKWTSVKENSKLYTNDILRVLHKSFVRLKWQNGNTIFVNENSQICINLRYDSIQNSLSQYTTLFFGAAFFIVNKILPKELRGVQETKVYTPTSCIAIRGTSFLTSVHENDGKTEIKTINGTVLVSNILKNQSLFLSAGYKTSISLNGDPLVPSPLIDSEIDSMRLWIPPYIISAEMLKQKRQAEKDYSTITGKYDDKILIMPFANNSQYNGPWKICEIFTNKLSEQLTSFNRTTIVTCDKNETETQPVKLGTKYKTGYVLTGEITTFDIIQKAEISAGADKYRESSIAQVCCNIQLVNISQKSVIYATTICENIKTQNAPENSWYALSKLKPDFTDSTFANSLIGRVLTKTVDQVLLHISPYLLGE